jgi:hypothetical protein
MADEVNRLRHEGADCIFKLPADAAGVVALGRLHRVTQPGRVHGEYMMPCREEGEDLVVGPSRFRPAGHQDDRSARTCYEGMRAIAKSQ